MGNRARGLLRGRQRLGLLPPRPRPQPGLPLGRGRAPRHLRPPGPALLRPGALERPGSHPEGAALRPHRARGQPRRGRQGVLLLPRLHPDPLLPQGALQVSRRPSSPTSSWCEENRQRGKADPEFELADTGVFDDGRYFDVFAEYAKASPDDIAIRITVANRGPEAATLHLLPTLWFRNTWSWGRGGRGLLGATRAPPRGPGPASSPSIRRWAATSSRWTRPGRRAARAALHRERDQRSSGSSVRPTRSPT